VEEASTCTLTVTATAAQLVDTRAPLTTATLDALIAHTELTRAPAVPLAATLAQLVTTAAAPEQLLALAALQDPINPDPASVLAILALTVSTRPDMVLPAVLTAQAVRSVDLVPVCPILHAHTPVLAPRAAA
jgi:hypothetical protein